MLHGSTCVWIELRKSLLSRKDKLGKKHSFKKNTNLVYSINGQVHHPMIIMKRERESYNVIDFIITKVFIYTFISIVQRDNQLVLEPSTGQFHKFL